MPLRFGPVFDRLPSLRYYTLISTSLLLSNILYFHHLIQSNVVDNSTKINGSLTYQSIFFSNSKPFSFAYIQVFLLILISHSLSLLILINLVYCLLALFAKELQILIFGELRPIESQRLKDKFWNYTFYKFCFLFGVLGSENFHELILWISWFSILAFALLFSQLAKDRYEFLTIRRQSLIKIFCLLISLLILCCILFTTCFLIGLKFGGLSIFFFMLAETMLLTLDISYNLFKYIFIYDLQISNEYRSNLFYYLDFFFDIITLTIDIMYHLQMLFYHQTFMSMASLIFFMQLKPLFHELTQRVKRHKLYRIAMIRMEKKYPLLTKYDRQRNHLSSSEDICSICWEKFDKARCLPCGHLFHQNCLHSWLEQDATCPICRLSLQDDTHQTPAAPQPTSNFRLWPNNVPNLTAGNNQRPARNHLFRFNGASWLPSFSIEINHNFSFRLGRPRLTTVQLTTMSQSIQHIFPQIPYEIIHDDLQQTQSINTTIENIIEQRIRLQSSQEEDTSGSEESSTSDDNLLSDSPQTREHEDVNFTWPLDPSLPLADRKQRLISYMRRQYLEHHRIN